jgi:hypothetical protein
MKQNNRILGSLLALVLIVQVLSIGYLYVNAERLNNEEEIVIPTAEEIASKVEVNVPQFDYTKITELWEQIYSNEIEELEAYAEEDIESEIEDNDYRAIRRHLESNVEGFDELEEVDIRDVTCEVINLGLKEDEDKSARCIFELRVEYTKESGQAIDWREVLLVEGIVVYEEGDFNEELVKLIF